MNKRFIGDAMFGRLAIFLRLLGYDTEIAGKDIDIDDTKIWERLAFTNQILLTRDRGLRDRVIHSYGEARVIFIDTKVAEEQLYWVFKTLHLPYESLVPKDGEEIPSRCSVCNGELIQVDKKEINEEISEGTANHINQFYRCTSANCRKIFWQGRHWDDILKVFRQVYEKLVSN